MRKNTSKQRKAAKTKQKTKKSPKGSATSARPSLPKCGLVMPISDIDGCPEEHWEEVREILEEVISASGFEPRLVSDADDIGIIQKRIIQNLYDDPIVVCDVSGKNPNVMFELGLRLAFDKPTIIIKDDKTSYSFDTAPIEHIAYPRDLRFAAIVSFKSLLGDKLVATHASATSDPKYTTFLKHFGDFSPAKVDIREVPSADQILEELRDLRRTIAASPPPWVRLDRGARVVGNIGSHRADSPFLRLEANRILRRHFGAGAKRLDSVDIDAVLRILSRGLSAQDHFESAAEFRDFAMQVIREYFTRQGRVHKVLQPKE